MKQNFSKNRAIFFVILITVFSVKNILGAPVDIYGDIFSGQGFSSSGGSVGDVTGPSSSADNAAARFDGTTGKLIQNSAVLIGDTGGVTITPSSTVAGLTLTQNNTSYGAYLEGASSLLSADVLRIVSSGGANGSRGIFIQQNSDAGALIIDATGAPHTNVGSNMTVFNVDGANTDFSMAKLTNSGISTTNNANLFVQNTAPTTTARVIQAHQLGTGSAIYADTTSSTNPAIEVASSTLGASITSTGYGLKLIGGTGLLYDGDSTGQATVGRTTGTGSGARLDITAGGAQSGQTDKAGGELRLSSGIATGNSTSDITFRTYGGGSSGTSDSTAREVMRIFGSGSANGRVAIGTTSLRSGADGLTLGGDTARVMWMNRNTTSNTAGNTLSIEAGGATSGATDKAGGNLNLRSGTSTGTGGGSVVISTMTPGSTGTSDNSYTTRLTLSSAGANFNSSPIVSAGAINSADSSQADARFTIPVATTITGSTTLGASHWSKRLIFNSASAITITLPQQSTTATVAGVWFEYENIGAGLVTFAIQGAETLSGNTVVAKNASGRIFRDTTTDWFNSGHNMTGYNTLIQTVANNTYTLVAYASTKGTIVGVGEKARALTTAGTFSIAINGVGVGGLGSLVPTTAGSYTAATSANTFVRGDVISITYSGSTAILDHTISIDSL